MYAVTLYEAPKKIESGERAGEYTFPYRGDEASLTWDELCFILSQVHFKPAKEEREMICGNQFGGLDRNKLNAQEMSVAIYDIDNKPDDLHISFDEVVNKLQQLKIKSLLYQTYSHSSKKNKFRLVLPLHRPISNDLYPGLLKPVISLLGLTSRMPCFDIKASTNIIGLNFLPSCPTGESREVKSITGEVLNWETLELSEIDTGGKKNIDKDWSFLSKYTGNLRSLDIEKLEPMRQGGRITDANKPGFYHIPCPWTEDHSNGQCKTKDTCIIKSDNDYPKFFCLHDSCHSNGRDIEQYLDLFTVEQVNACCIESYVFESDTAKIFEQFVQVEQENRNEETAKTIKERYESLPDEFDQDAISSFFVALSLETSRIIIEQMIKDVSKKYGLDRAMARAEYKNVTEELKKLAKQREKEEKHKHDMYALSNAVENMTHSLYFAADGSLYELINDRWCKRNFRLAENTLLSRGVPRDLISDAKMQIPICEGTIYYPIKPDKVIITPSGEYLNTFYGYPLTPEEGDWTIPAMILEHLCSADKRPDEYEWALQWLARLAQNAYIDKTAKKNLSSLVFATCPGAGKGMLGKILNYIWGENFGFLDKNAVSDSFTASTLLNSTLAICDEIHFDKSKDGQNLANKLKILITEDKIAIRRMHREAEESFSWVNLIFFSNHSHKALYIEEGDRRFMVYNQEVPIIERYGQSFLDQYNDALTSGELEKQAAHFLDYLLKKKITFNLAKPPQTEAKQKLVNSGMNSIQAFIDEVRNFGLTNVIEAQEYSDASRILHRKEDEVWVEINDIKRIYREWCKLEGRKTNTSSNLGSSMAEKMEDVEVKNLRISGRVTRCVGGTGLKINMED